MMIMKHIQNRKPLFLYAGSVIGATVILLALIICEEFLFLGRFQAGSILCGAEVVFSLFTSAFLFFSLHRKGFTNSKRNAIVSLAPFFCFLGMADGFYCYRYYLHHYSNKTVASFLLVTVPYTLSYLMGAVAIILHDPRIFKKSIKTPFVFIPVALTIPVFLHCAHATFQANNYSLRDFGLLLNTITSFIFIVTCIINLLVNRGVRWAVFCIGGMTLIIVNWSLGTELMQGAEYHFGYYEYFWSFGVFLCVMSAIWFQSESLEADADDDSIIPQMRVIVFAVITFFVLGMAIIHRFHFSAVKMISLGITIGSIAAVYAGEILAERIAHYSSLMGRFVRGNAHAEHCDDEIRAIPVELREVYETTFRGQLEMERVKRQSEMHMQQLGAHVAHDIRSPISVLKAFVQYASETNSPVEEEFVASARRSVERIVSMAGQILDYSKATHISHTSVRIGSLIGCVISDVNASRKSNIINCAYDDMEASVRLDHGKMERVLVNIIDNALSAVDAEGGTVHIDTRVRDDGHLSLRIMDNGRGIEASHMDKVFDQYFTYGKKHGTGLGLAYCKQVVEAHGGTIAVASEVGKGTTFTIHIPNCVVSGRERDDRVTTRADVVSINVSQKNILIADDDADIRRQWKRIVDAQGGSIICSAGSAEEVQARSDIDYAGIDTAIVDYNYEGYALNGVDLVAYLKGKGVRNVHLCTGFHDDEEIRRRAKEAGADSVIPKPIDEGTVSRMI